MEKHIFGLFESRDKIPNIMQDLNNIGIAMENVSVIENKEDVDRTITSDTGSKVKKTALTGAGAGAAGGATAGVIGGIVMAVTGPIGIAAGIATTAAAAVGGSVVGALTGGLAGTLVGLGFPKGVAKAYEEGVKKNGVLLGVPAEKTTEEKVKKIFEVYEGKNIQTLSINKESA